ncbi:MAG: DUF3857 domain-containing protein [Bryobacteraceae bacterium]
MQRPSHFIALFSLLVFGIFNAIPASAQQKTLSPPEFIQWLPLPDADRALQAPLVEKDAGAEILLWRAHVVDEFLGDNRSFQRATYHYIRMKIFDDKGKERAATIDLPYREPGGILNVSGRTIKADGTILELDRKTVYSRNIERVGGRRQSVVSFAMPGVERGAILEYRWRQTQDDNRFRYVRLNFQREFPVQKVTYFVKPLSSQYVVNEEMLLAPFNCKPSPIKQEIDGYASTSLENIPASHDEAYAPSDPNVEQWALLYYRRADASKNPDKYWESEGKRVYKDLKDSLKTDEDTKAAAAKALAGATGENDKINALIVYLHKSLKSLNDPSLTDAERQKFIEKMPDRPRTSAEILKSGIATSYEMNVVFAALAGQAGLDVRPALVADRGEIMFNPKLAERYFLDNMAVAIKQSTSWKIMDVSSRFLTPGMLPWQEEGMFALVTDPKAPVFVKTPDSPAETSAQVRKAELKLTEEGELTGDITETLTGHKAEEYRVDLFNKSAAQREEWLKDRVTRMFPDAEVTNIKLLNAEETTQPLIVSYHLSAERFAQVTGKRILFQPVVFHRGQGNRFTTSQRRYPIEFPYAWRERDDLQIKLPEGYSLDNADAPASLKFGKPGEYSIEFRVSKEGSPALLVAREMTFGKESQLYFDAAVYPALKKIFDEVQVRDRHGLSLKGN